MEGATEKCSRGPTALRYLLLLLLLLLKAGADESKTVVTACNARVPCRAYGGGGGESSAVRGLACRERSMGVPETGRCLTLGEPTERCGA